MDAAPNYELPEPPEIQEDLEDRASAPVCQPVAAPMLIDDDDDLEGVRIEAKKAEAVDQAFSAGPFFWKGFKLAPFAIDREADWIQLREFLGEPPLGDLFALPDKASLADALRVIWFCAHAPREWLSIPTMIQDPDTDQWRRITGQERALAIESKIRAWAAVNIHPTEGQLAVDLFFTIFTSAHSTRAVAKPSDSREEAREKKSPPPPAAPST